MLHAKAFVRDGEEVIAGTCNLEAWSLKRFFEIDLQLWSSDVAAQFEERFSAPAEAVSDPGSGSSAGRSAPGPPGSRSCRLFSRRARPSRAAGSRRGARSGR